MASAAPVSIAATRPRAIVLVRSTPYAAFAITWSVVYGARPVTLRRPSTRSIGSPIGFMP